MRGAMKLSYVSGPGSEPLLYKTIGAVLEEAAARWGDQTALIVPHQHVRWSWRELDEAVDRFAAGLLSLGLEPGDRIGIWSPNRYEWVVTQFASARAGLILVNVNPAYRVSELEFALNKVGCKALVLAPRFKNSEYAGMLLQMAPEISSCDPGNLRLDGLPSLRVLIAMEDGPARGFLAYRDLYGDRKSVV